MPGLGSALRLIVALECLRGSCVYIVSPRPSIHGCMAARLPHGVRRLFGRLVSESIPSICRDNLSTELSRNRICKRDGQQKSG